MVPSGWLNILYQRFGCFVVNRGFYKEFKYFNSAPTTETSNSVIFDNLDIDQNLSAFLLKHLRLNHPKKILAGHLNINSIRNKFDLLKK